MIVFIDFSLTVKASTLIFISGCGLAISSAKEGKSGFIYNLVKSWSAFWATQASVHFMKILTVYTLNSHLLTFKAHYRKMCVFCHPLNIWSVTDKQCAPRSNCSCRSSLIWVHNVCLYAYVKGNCGKYFPHWDLFNSLHTVCFMYGLPIYEIKGICHLARFFIICQGSFQHFTKFLKKKSLILS